MIIDVGVVPSPDLIDAIFIGSDPNAPTISNSGLCGEKPVVLVGNLSPVSINLAVLLNAFDNLL